MKRHEIEEYVKKFTSLSLEEFIEYRRKEDCVSLIKNGKKAGRNSGIVTAIRLVNKICTGSLKLPSYFDNLSIRRDYYCERYSPSQKVLNWFEENLKPNDNLNYIGSRYNNNNDVGMLGLLNHPKFEDAIKMFVPKYIISNMTSNDGSYIGNAINNKKVLFFTPKHVNHIDNFRAMEYYMMKHLPIESLSFQNDKVYLLSYAK
jgi:hypothetical protein